MQTKIHKVDLCVIGGGLAGMSAAIAAAQHGTKVVLMQDRPVLGGNASSEIRMGISGAHGEYNRETGIIDQILMENLYRNSGKNWSLWDSVLYKKVKFEDNISLLLNCSCNDATMDNNRIKSIKGWQLTTETWHIVEAEFFADCSGDSILAPLSGAEFRQGREAEAEFKESIAPTQADDKTMGMSLLIQARETEKPQEFIPPEWAFKYKTDSELQNRDHQLPGNNFWWIEIGGEQDTIHDSENLRDELLKIAFGVWDHIKNEGDHKADNWKLEWLGFLPGKRESRRYVGKYILNQNDVRSEGKFEDLVAYGGWTMDVHHPAGFYHSGDPTIFHSAPSPFGIPYRSLYSVNIENLFFAGRNISATHVAMSATRVMATCATMGQAVGTAAAIAIDNDLTPHEVYQEKIILLKQKLMTDDCYLPGNVREINKLTKEAKLTSSEGDPAPLRNGIDRPVNGNNNCWEGSLNSWVEYSFDIPQQITGIRLVFDNNLNPSLHMPCDYPLDKEDDKMPKKLIKNFRIEALTNGKWSVIIKIKNNYQRLVKIQKKCKADAFRIIPEETWGAEKAVLFAWDLIG